MLPAEIISFSQDMDLSDGSVSNYLSIRLSTGIVIKALISDEGARQVVHAKVVGAPAPPQPPQEAAVSAPVQELSRSNDEEDAFVFGGSESEASPAAPPPPAYRPNITRVETDHLGYPIVRTAGGVDPGEIVGGRDRDEDGVGQV